MAFCLGMILLLLVGGAAYFLSGTPGGGGAGVSDRGDLLGQQESADDSGAGGSQGGATGIAGRLDGARSTDGQEDSRTAFGLEEVPAGAGPN